MHNEEASFLAITVSAVEQGPRALQKLVEAYFHKSKIFGTDCFVAFGDLEIGRSDGVVPEHHISLRYFGEQIPDNGLPHGTDLYGFIEDMQKDPEKCFYFHRSWDNGCSHRINCDD